MFTQPTQIPRSPLASTLTLLFHVCLVLVVVAASAVPRVLPQVHDGQSLMYVATAPPPVLTFEVAPPPRPAEPAPKVVEVPAIETRLTRVPEPAPEPVRVPPERPKPPAPPAPVPPPVAVGAFADTPSAPKRERELAIADAGFASDASASNLTRRQLQIVQGFDAAAGATRPGRARTATTVSDAGFGANEPSHAPATAPARVSSTGFSDPGASRAPARPASPAATTPAGFAAAPPAARAAAPARAVRPSQTPVEILHKPTPAYTDEARSQGIQGEVSVEVEFTAAGRVRIVRIVRGLGYGLDEMARRAAEQIRFTPATRDGVPVDFRTTLTIVFRLT